MRHRVSACESRQGSIDEKRRTKTKMMIYHAFRIPKRLEYISQFFYKSMVHLASWALLLTLSITVATVSWAAVTPPERITKAGKIIFCTELAYPPWEMINAVTNAAEGFDIDIATALAKAMGVASEHKDIAYDGLIPALQAGQCDAIISGLANTQGRREVVDFVDYAIAGNAVIVRAEDEAQFETLEELSGLKVSVAVGSALEGELRKVNEKLKADGKVEINILALQSGTDAFQQLISGLADAYLGSTDQVAYFNKQRPGLLRLASPQLLALTIGFATLKKDRDLYEALDSAFREIKADGRYQAIVSEWGFEAVAIQN